MSLLGLFSFLKVLLLLLNFTPVVFLRKLGLSLDNFIALFFGVHAKFLDLLIWKTKSLLIDLDLLNIVLVRDGSGLDFQHTAAIDRVDNLNFFSTRLIIRKPIESYRLKQVVFTGLRFVTLEYLDDYVVLIFFHCLVCLLLFARVLAISRQDDWQSIILDVSAERKRNYVCELQIDFRKETRETSSI